MNRIKYKYHYLYKITCLINNKFYIGIHSTNNINDNYMSSSKSVKSSIRIYGIENHIKTIIEFCKGRKSLVAKEKKTVNDSLLKNELCMNLMPGGLGDLTIELQLRRSSLGGKANALKLKNDPELLKKIYTKIFSLFEKYPELEEKTNQKILDLQRDIIRDLINKLNDATAQKILVVAEKEINYLNDLEKIAEEKQLQLQKTP